MENENKTGESDQPTLDEIETLAAQLCPDLWKQNPDEAVRAARKLWDIQDQEAWHIVLRARTVEADKILEEQEARRPRGFEEGLVAITKRGTKKQRLNREKEYFEGFLLSEYGAKAKANTALKRFETEGFTRAEVEELTEKFAAWWPRRNRKGKQGRVKNREKDPRVKPRSVAMPQLKSYLGGMPDESA